MVDPRLVDSSKQVL